MKKDDAQKAIRHMCNVWVKEQNIQGGASEMPSFGKFRCWADTKGYCHYFDFRSVMGAHNDAGMWFYEELGQSWRN